jgi:hypothetical protein
MPVDLASARRFLELFAESGPITFQVFPDNKQGKESWHETAEFDEIAPKLVQANQRGCGVYFMVNTGDGLGRKSENVRQVRALFIDLDNAPIEPVRCTEVEPHAIIESSPGKYQAFYLTDDCQLEEFSSYQRALIHKFNSDPAIHDLARVMRIPGFYHQKKEPFQTRIILLNPGLPYKVSDIRRFLDLKFTPTITKAPLPKLSELKPQSITEGTRHEFLLRLAVKYANMGYSQEEVYFMVQGANHTCCSPPKSDDEVKRLIQFSQSTKPPEIQLPELPPKVAPQVKAPQVDSVALPEELINCAPGLVGEIAAWINESSIYHHPALALAASISFVGALKAHRVASQTNLRTNMLVLGVAPSGSGKNHAMECIERLAKASSVDGIIGGKPASDAGLLKSLIDNRGRRLILWDELGLALQEITNPKAAGYKAAILRAMMELFSKAGSTYRGVEYANHDNRRQRTDLDQPCLCVYGASTPGRFYDSLSSSHAVDGFLARLLVFETKDGYPTRRKVKSPKIPEKLIAACKAIQRMPINAEADPGSSDSLFIPDPAIIRLADDSEVLFDKALREFDQKRKEAGQRNEALESLWARAGEHAIKLALVVESGSQIERVTLEWALEVTTILVDNLTKAVATRISDGQYEKELKRILRAIEVTGEDGLTARAIYRRFNLPPRKANDILATLVHSGQIEHREIVHDGAGRPTKSFVAIYDGET